MGASRRSLTVGAALAGWLIATCAAGAVKVINLPGNDMVYSSQKGLLYVSVPGRAGSQGNAVAVIDPQLGQVVSSLPVGLDPYDLALSSDGQHLYVGLDGEAAVRRVGLSPLTAGPKISLGNDSHGGPLAAEEIEVQPGDPDVIAVALASTIVTPRGEGVAIFDGGVRRPIVTNPSDSINQIEFSTDPAILYGYNNETTEFGFRTMKVDSQGVSVSAVAQDVITGFGVEIELVSGLIFTSAAEVMNPNTSLRVGVFAPLDSTTSVLPEPGQDRVLFLTESALETHRLSTFTRTGSRTLPAEALGRPSRLVRWSDNGLAFLTSEGQIVLWTEEETPGPPAGPWLSTGALPGFEAKVLINGVTSGRKETDCTIETLCVSGALAGRPEVFVKVIGPRPNGFLWAQISRFTPSKVEVWLRQASTGKINYYVLAPVPQEAEDVSGFQDREAFQP